MTIRKNLGDWGEQLAKKYLSQRGYHFIAQNYKSGRQEIDLIFSLNQKFIFIEVKTRIKTLESRLEAPLRPTQMNNLERALINYCLKNKINLDNTRFDLIVILVNKIKHSAELKHYRNIL